MNLFVSFILRAISVFIKDGVLYAKEDSEHCFIHTVSKTSCTCASKAGCTHAGDGLWHLCWHSLARCFYLSLLKLECRAVMIFFHYCVLSNYFWLFIEGLYLFTLLVETFFPEKRYFYWYIIIGWGEMSYMPCCRCIHISKCHVVYLVMLVSGTPTVCVTIWAVLRLHFDDIGWVMNNTVSRVSCFCCICAEHFILSSALLAAGTWMTMLPSGGW